MVTLLEETPPLDQPMRYGNRAFQSWIDKIKSEKDSLAQTVFGPELEKYKPAWEEIFVYWMDSFGDRTRLDYGTGHELNFLVVLLILVATGWIREQEFEGVANCVVRAYLSLMRTIQTTYFLEPAGSHGVWGLDDYQFLPFILGAAQLKGHTEYTPDSIHSEATLNQEHKEYLYFGCVYFIRQVKKGVPFGESSPMLNDISGVPTWAKVCQGLQKMYLAEVLGKLPVIKHLRFGSVLRF